MDFDLRLAKPAEVEALKKFRKTDFAADQVVGLAEEMVYYNVLVTFISTQLRDPSETFVRFVAGEIPAIERVTGKVVERLTPILRKAIQASIVDHVARSFNKEPEAPPPHVETPLSPLIAPAHAEVVSTATPDEVESWNIITAIVKQAHSDATVQHRHSKTYFTIFQKNIRKWFIHLVVDRAPNWIAFRHIRVEDARRLCPTAEISPGGQFGDCKLAIRGVADLKNLRPLILASYEAESARLVTDESGEFDLAH